MAIWKVIKRDDVSYLLDSTRQKEVVLFLRLEFGDVTTNLSSHDSMHKALYDEYQCNESMKDGDVILTLVGKFYCHGVHVVSQTEHDSLEEK